MATIRIEGVETLGRLAARVEGANARLLAQTLNRAMAPSATKVRRELADHTGAPYRRVSAVVVPYKASASNLTYQVDAKDGWMSLKDFSAREVRAGTSAAPWKKRRLFTGAFMMGGPKGRRVPIAKLNGHVFVRSSKERLPIRKLWGPNIAREMIRDGAAPVIVWREDVERLPLLIMREVKRRIEAGA